MRYATKSIFMDIAELSEEEFSLLYKEGYIQEISFDEDGESFFLESDAQDLLQEKEQILSRIAEKEKYKEEQDDLIRAAIMDLYSDSEMERERTYVVDERFQDHDYGVYDFDSTTSDSYESEETEEEINDFFFPELEEDPKEKRKKKRKRKRPVSQTISKESPKNYSESHDYDKEINDFLEKSHYVYDDGSVEEALDQSKGTRKRNIPKDHTKDHNFYSSPSTLHSMSEEDFSKMVDSFVASQENSPYEQFFSKETDPYQDYKQFVSSTSSYNRIETEKRSYFENPRYHSNAQQKQDFSSLMPTYAQPNMRGGYPGRETFSRTPYNRREQLHSRLYEESFAGVKGVLNYQAMNGSYSIRNEVMCGMLGKMQYPLYSNGEKQLPVTSSIIYRQMQRSGAGVNGIARDNGTNPFRTLQNPLQRPSRENSNPYMHNAPVPIGARPYHFPATFQNMMYHTGRYLYNVSDIRETTAMSGYSYVMQHGGHMSVIAMRRAAMRASLAQDWKHIRKIYKGNDVLNALYSSKIITRGKTDSAVLKSLSDGISIENMAVTSMIVKKYFLDKYKIDINNIKDLAELKKVFTKLAYSEELLFEFSKTYYSKVLPKNQKLLKTKFILRRSVRHLLFRSIDQTYFGSGTQMLIGVYQSAKLGVVFSRRLLRRTMQKEAVIGKSIVKKTTVPIPTKSAPAIKKAKVVQGQHKLNELNSKAKQIKALKTENIRGKGRLQRLKESPKKILDKGFQSVFKKSFGETTVGKFLLKTKGIILSSVKPLIFAIFGILFICSVAMMTAATLSSQLFLVQSFFHTASGEAVKDGHYEDSVGGQVLNKIFDWESDWLENDVFSYAKSTPSKVAGHTVYGGIDPKTGKKVEITSFGSENEGRSGVEYNYYDGNYYSAITGKHAISTPNDPDEEDSKDKNSSSTEAAKKTESSSENKSTTENNTIKTTAEEKEASTNTSTEKQTDSQIQDSKTMIHKPANTTKKRTGVKITTVSAKSKTADNSSDMTYQGLPIIFSNKGSANDGIQKKDCGSNFRTTGYSPQDGTMTSSGVRATPFVTIAMQGSKHLNSNYKYRNVRKDADNGKDGDVYMINGNYYILQDLCGTDAIDIFCENAAQTYKVTKSSVHVYHVTDSVGSPKQVSYNGKTYTAVKIGSGSSASYIFFDASFNSLGASGGSSLGIGTGIMNSNAKDIISMSAIYFAQDVNQKAMTKYCKDLFEASHAVSASLSEIYQCNEGDKTLENYNCTSTIFSDGKGHEKKIGPNGTSYGLLDGISVKTASDGSAGCTKYYCLDDATTWADGKHKKSHKKNICKKETSSKTVEMTYDELKSWKANDKTGEHGSYKKQKMTYDHVAAAAAKKDPTKKVSCTITTTTATCKGHYGCPEEHTKKYCTGHVDLYVNACIVGADTKNEAITLYKIDPGLKESNKKQYRSMMDSFEFTTWTSDRIDMKELLEAEDWKSVYGIDIQSMANTVTGSGSFSKNPLTEEEIEKIMKSLPDNLSVKRQKVIKTALSAVGKIPYYFGGAASHAGFNGNNFGAKIGADTKGRTKKGLDCSHFVDWVYWTALGDNLGNGATSSLRSSNKFKDVSSLKPGDIVIRGTKTSGASAHTAIYLGRSNGKMMYIDCQGLPINMVEKGSGSMFEKNGNNGSVQWRAYKGID